MPHSILTIKQVAVRLEYDHDGVLVSQTPCPRAVGTTVAVRGLFQPLPVRHREFMRNLKKEFAKLQGILQAYAIIR